MIASNVSKIAESVDISDNLFIVAPVRNGLFRWLRCDTDIRRRSMEAILLSECVIVVFMNNVNDFVWMRCCWTTSMRFPACLAVCWLTAIVGCSGTVLQWTELFVTNLTSWVGRGSEIAIITITTGLRDTFSAYFSVYYYTKCVLLKAGCATLKRTVCNIKFLPQKSKYKLYIISCKTAANPLKTRNVGQCPTWLSPCRT